MTVRARSVSSPRGMQGGYGSELELVGQSAQELGGGLRRLGVGVTPGAVALLDALQQPDQVLDDADHVLRLLPLCLATVLRDRRWGVQHLHLVGLLALATREDPELDASAGLEGGDSVGQRRRAHIDVVPVLTREETESLLGVVPLDLSGWHRPGLSLSRILRRSAARAQRTRWTETRANEFSGSAPGRRGARSSTPNGSRADPPRRRRSRRRARRSSSPRRPR